MGPPTAAAGSGQERSDSSMGQPAATEPATINFIKSRRDCDIVFSSRQPEDRDDRQIMLQRPAFPFFGGALEKGRSQRLGICFVQMQRLKQARQKMWLEGAHGDPPLPRTIQLVARESPTPQNAPDREPRAPPEREGFRRAFQGELPGSA